VPSVENDNREIPRSSKSEFVSVDEVEQRVCDILGRYGDMGQLGYGVDSS
jgi:hypothetical protein